MLNQTKDIPEEIKRYAKDFDVNLADMFENNSLVNIDNNIFLSNRDSLEIADEIIQKSKENPHAIGTFLGNITNVNNIKKFTPSPAFPDLLAKRSNKKITINSKAEWLFLCGRDVFDSSVLKKSNSLRVGDLVLVQNENNENLGIGKVNQKIIKNVLDKGSYLRDEK